MTMREERGSKKCRGQVWSVCNEKQEGGDSCIYHKATTNL